MIDKLEYLLALANEKHFGRAAEACGVSQPSMSLGLKQLEEQLGVMLVRRGSRFIGLTAEGERTLEWARRIVGDARAMRQDVRAIKQGLTGRMRIAVIPAALPMVTAVTAPLAARHPDIQFTILSRPWSEMCLMLDNLEIDAAITYVDVEPLSRVTTIPLYRERYRLVASMNSPISQLASISWADAAKMPLCLLTPNTQNRQIVETLLHGAGGKPSIVVESDSMTVLLAHVRTGNWLSVVPEKLVQASRMAVEFCTIPIVDPDVTHTIGVVMPVRDPASPLATALAGEARRAAAQLLD
jgi:DNA-binding transcriptional LysR family regulator